MLKAIGITAALLAVGAVPAFAQDTCPVPPLPAVVDGAAASLDQMKAAHAAVNAYMSASDTYQNCIGDFVTAAKEDAAKNKKPADAAMIQAELAKVDANQNNKQMVGDKYNSAVGDYKKAHPPTP
jgi:hypothetical protein